MPKPPLLILAYDPECVRCRAWVDWIQKRDTACRVVAFPIQNAELLRVAPELAGLPLMNAMHALDTKTRMVHVGASLVRALLSRLPWWRVGARLLGLTGVSGLVFGHLASRHHPSSRQNARRF